MKKIMSDFQQGNIDRKEYAETMFKKHESLLDYKALLENSMVKEITIDKDDVCICVETAKRVYKMGLYPMDCAATPVTFLSFGSYENEEMDMCLNLLDQMGKKCICLDVGGNLGWYTLNFKNHNNVETVYTFEPIPDSFVKLKRNLQLNDMETENVFNIGLFNENKTEEFFYDVVASGASSLADLRELETTQKVQCSLRTMDSFVDEHKIGRIDFVKCDVEGAEKFVYEGGIETIARFKPIVFSEMLRKWAAKLDYHPNHIIELFENLGYGCFVSINQKLVPFHRVDEDTQETNYFFLHLEKHRDLIRFMA